jgi:nitrogen fixation NifU-like protein
LSDRINKLYPDAIKSHNERPYHFGKQEGTPTLKAYNPICGDKFDLYVRADETTITAIHFHGVGCAISKASTSILAKVLEGKTLVEAHRMCNNFLQVISNETSTGDSVLNDEFKIFSAIHEFPERRECVSLAWTEMLKFLESKSKKQR